MSVLELMRKWAELEPERCKEHLGCFHFVIDDTGRLWPIEKTGKNQVDEWVLCGAIEAAIVEREFRMMMMYGKSLETFEFTWTVLIGDGTSGPKQMKGRSSTKLEALLSAYVQALEAAK